LWGRRLACAVRRAGETPAPQIRTPLDFFLNVFENRLFSTCRGSRRDGRPKAIGAFESGKKCAIWKLFRNSADFVSRSRRIRIVGFTAARG
jgi:hypothetical protein